MKKLKRTFVFLALPLFIYGLGSIHAQSSQLNSEIEILLQYQKEISIDFLRQHLSHIASDAMKGRDTGSPQLLEVSEYLADQYRKMGLKVATEGESYLQPYSIDAQITDSLIINLTDRDTTRILTRNVVKKKSRSVDFVRLFGGTSSVRAEIVFAGFGVNDPSRDVAHLEGIDLAGKWVLVFNEIPNIVGNDTLLDPSIGTRSRFQTILMQNNAKGLIVIHTDKQAFQAQADQQADAFGKATNMSLSYLKQQSQQQPWTYLAIHPQRAASLLDLPNTAALDDFKQSIIDDMSGFSPHTLPNSLHYQIFKRDTSLTAHNVVAVLEGSDPELKKEYVVLSAHHDHVGIGAADSTGDRIYNGADDDGSGTVALLNIARALKTARENGHGPSRSVIFLHVSGEEKGLLGSRYYSDHPERPIEQTIANLNIDMIGRVDEQHKKKGIEKYAYIIGGDIISSGLDSLITLANRHTGNILLSDRYNDLRDPNQFYRRSDHWNFGRLGVPFAFFFTGVHEDYHQPSDEIHKIKFDKMSDIIKTIYGSIVFLSETTDRPIVDNQVFINITRTQAR